MTPEEKRPFVQRLFTRIAPRYDVFNRLASCGQDQQWRSFALAAAGLQPQHRVLDVCAGTGDLSFQSAQWQQGRGLVVALDFTWEMLAHGRRRSEARRAASVHWVQADALQLPFEEAQFDRVVVGFSTRNWVDLDAGLLEMLRVLRPGGQLIVLETGRPAHPLLRAGYFAYLFGVAPLIGFLLTGRLWPFWYLARSVKNFVTPAQFVERLRNMKVQVEYVGLSHGLASLYVATKRHVSVPAVSSSHAHP
jgi:demethylmenaquinone methyltransferase/2-methoxy-6-polyprenyl-1,4-benzoquinol methylase